MSAAVLFYGYSLGAPDDTGWEIEHELDFDEEWFITALNADEDYVKAMQRRLLLESGVPEDELVSFDLADRLAQVCGVRFVEYGHSNTLFYGLALEGSVYEANDWSPACIKPDFDWNASVVTPGVDVPSDQSLRGALEVLGMQPVQVRPSWIIAPREY
jgi:hypothetical protein